jgi:protein TonB
MFDVLVESTSRRGGARTWTLFAASSAFWLLVLAGVAIAGVFAYDGRLDAEFDDLDLVAAVPPAPPPPRTTSPRQQDAGPPASRAFESLARAPETVSPPRPAPPSIGAPVPGAIDGGAGDGSQGGEPFGNGFGPVGPVVGGHGPVPPPPPRPPVEPKVEEPRRAPARPHVSRVLTGIATKRVEPRYPDIAVKANVEGDVVVEVTVSETGQVISARVLSGHPLLRDAAERAARQWRFTPTILGESPVKVVGTITFSFRR